jgi:hypothetical protein
MILCELQGQQRFTNASSAGYDRHPSAFFRLFMQRAEHGKLTCSVVEFHAESSDTKFAE